MNQRRSVNSWLNAQMSIGNNFYNLEDNSRPLLRIREESNSFFPRNDESRNTLYLFNLQNTLNFQDINKKVYNFFEEVQQQPTDIKKEDQQSQISVSMIDDPKSNKKGLRFLARLVFQTMKQKRINTHQQVVSFVQKYILKNMTSNKQIEKQGKNIKRRLYDALNVMIAAEILQKNFSKLEIKVQNIQISQKYNRLNQKIELQRQLSQYEARVRQKKRIIKQLKEKQSSIQSLVTRNQNFQNSNPYKIKFPLLAMKLNRNFKFRLQIDYKEIHLTSSNQAEIYADLDLLSYIFHSKEDQFVLKMQPQQNY